MPGRVALTGATGFIGGNLLASLVKSNFPVQALTRRPRDDSPLVHWVNGDLNNRRALAELVEGCDAVLHCAGAVRGNSLQAFLEVNFRGAQNLLDEVRKQSSRPRFLLISSLAARYPAYSWYARSKSQAEALLRSGQYPGLPWTIYRPTAVYGPGDREMAPLFRTMRRGFLLAPKVAGARISLLHIADLADAVLKWLTAQDAAGLFELDDGAPGGYDWNDIAAAGQAAWKRPVTLVQVPVPLLRGLARVNLLLAGACRRQAMLTPGKVNEITHRDWVCDNAPLTECLGWTPRVNLTDALAAASMEPAGEQA